jgi:hypothetical protein
MLQHLDWCHSIATEEHDLKLQQDSLWIRLQTFVLHLHSIENHCIMVVKELKLTYLPIFGCVKITHIWRKCQWHVYCFFFIGCIELQEDTVETLLSTACLLQLTAVVDACCSFLMKQLHPSNCIGIRLFADAQGCMDLLKVAHNFTTVRNLFNCFQVLSVQLFWSENSTEHNN